MERSSLLRWLLIGAAIFLFLQVGLPWLRGDQESAGPSPLAGLVDYTAPPEDERTAESTCLLDGPRFAAELTSKGAALKHARMKDGKYTDSTTQEPIDLVTNDRQSRLPLRTNLRDVAGTATQVPYDDLDWTLASRTSKSCTFVYESDDTKLEKVISVTERPFELTVSLTVTNKAEEAKKHRLTIEQHEYRTQKETEGSWGRLAEFHTIAEVRSAGETHRYDPSDFEADEFGDEEFTDEKWRRPPGNATWAAVSSSYFSKAVMHVEGPSTPAGETLIEEMWESSKYSKSHDPNYGHVYRARLNYGTQELQPRASARYEMLAYVGPKEREVLAAVGGGADYDAVELLDLGVFGWIGKFLIRYLYLLHELVGTWGIAICLLTITVKILLFPLSISQIKSSMAMRKLKPQMDELNAKYKEDATQRGLAMQELWRKNNVTNPMLGCLPVLLQMPVWFALYTALQTAVELYHTSFLWFPDLSAPDPYYTIPIILGGSSYLQQMLMPMQGDALQQKMMKYMMPAMFTVFMLFLPAGLGIYFLTNTWLGIGQQLAVERYYKSQADKNPPAEESASDDGSRKVGKSDKAKKAEPKTA
jgi:YidC/Oxa1 family membrane protein insertase